MSKTSNSPPGSFMQHLMSAWSLLRKIWPIWTFIFSLVLGLGLIQVQSVKLIIPPQYLGYLFATLIIAGFFCIVVVLTVKNNKLTNELSDMRQELHLLEKNASPSFLLEDIALSSLMAHVEMRKALHKTNPVKLDVLRIECRIVGMDSRKDADVKYYLKGINISDHPLTGMYLSIAGDNLTPFNSLGAKLYNLHSSTGTSYPLQPRLEGPDSVRKDLFLPFVSPGIDPLGTFELELTYLWPRTFSLPKDYWFLDHLDYEGVTRQVIIKLEFVDVTATSVRAYMISSSSKIPYFLGQLPADPGNPKQFIFDKTNPDRDAYYMIIFEAA